MTDTISLSIRRDADTIQTFTVPYSDGMSVLDALKYLSSHDADDLAFRWECGQGMCGVCTMMVNGSPALSCMVLAQPGSTYTCEPLAGFPIKKDLVVNLEPATENMLHVQPWLIEGGKSIESRTEAEASKKVRTCVECWACVSVCPVSAPVLISESSGGTHALGMVKLARFALDPRDGANRAELAQVANLSVFASTCPTCRRCADVCPKDIDVYIDAVQVLERTTT